MSDPTQTVSVEKPWVEIERRWEALGQVEQTLVERANDALATSARSRAMKYELRARSDALFEAAALLRDALQKGEAP